MGFLLEVENETDHIEALLEDLGHRPALIEDDVQRLRRAFYRRGGLDKALARRIFRTNRLLPAPPPFWTEFYLETLTDFFLTRHGNEIHLGKAAEGMLSTWMGDAVPIADRSERRLLLRIMLRATDIPDRVQRMVLDTVRYNLISENRRLLSEDHKRPGVIDAIDMQCIRKMVFGAGGQYAIPVSRAVADFLFKLDQQVTLFVDRPAWQELLVHAIAHHVSGYDASQQKSAEIDGAQMAAWLKGQIRASRSQDDAARLLTEIVTGAPCVPNSIRSLARSFIED